METIKFRKLPETADFLQEPVFNKSVLDFDMDIQNKSTVEDEIFDRQFVLKNAVYMEQSDIIESIFFFRPKRVELPYS